MPSGGGRTHGCRRVALQDCGRHVPHPWRQIRQGLVGIGAALVRPVLQARLREVFTTDDDVRPICELGGPLLHIPPRNHVYAKYVVRCKVLK